MSQPWPFLTRMCIFCLLFQSMDIDSLCQKITVFITFQSFSQRLMQGIFSSSGLQCEEDLWNFQSPDLIWLQFFHETVSPTKVYWRLTECTCLRHRFQLHQNLNCIVAKEKWCWKMLQHGRTRYIKNLHNHGLKRNDRSWSNSMKNSHLFRFWNNRSRVWTWNSPNDNLPQIPAKDSQHLNTGHAGALPRTAHEKTFDPSDRQSLRSPRYLHAP
jgi:hypothetical protein